jgi:hypothetical protein
VLLVIFQMMAQVSAFNALHDLTCDGLIVKDATLIITPGVVKLDPWLEPFSEALRRRYSKTQDWIKTINDTEGGLEKFSRVSS